ncbi:hypothetical protein F442_07393 [Phytophthora nicotianae P10297]|uniref:Alpha/beta hydrolase fold-3 domain-containing protein n=1 Tax=Phytophthora nicotianae P10297 TaxID=1317064 RepID=W2ZHA2_PHYNI|nr:hypothetical protein F442_07393 [Phytophthora nicotianae P10297]
MKTSTSTTELQKCEHRLMQLLVLVLLLCLVSSQEQRREYSVWMAAGVSGIAVVLFLLESTRSLCRTSSETARFLAQIVRTLWSTLIQYAARGFKPKFPKWTLRFELVRGIMHDAATLFGDRIVDPIQAPVFRWHSELFGSFMGWFPLRRHGLQLESVHYNGLEHLWLKSSNRINNSTRLVLLFYHGGGYAVLSPRMYIPFCCELLKATMRELSPQASNENITIDLFIANYRKIPEHPFPVPVEDAVTMYEYLLQQEKLNSSQIMLIGDSAGGGLVMSTLLRVRDGKSSWKPKLPLPLAAIVACPLVDLTGDDDKSKAPNCVLSSNLMAASIETYRPRGKSPHQWADASPVHCDLQALPPIFLQAASFDYLFDHAVRLAAKAKADGVTNWEIDIHDEVTHVFMLFPTFVLPYARVGIQRMATFAAKQFLKSPTMHGKHNGMLKTDNAVTHSLAPSAA